MFSGKSSINLREGVTVNVFVAPSLYGVAVSRGLDIVSPIEATDKMAVVRRYSQIAYCAAIDAWEIDRVDNPAQGEFPYKYEDFYTWAWNDGEGFLAFIDFVSRAITGKSLAEFGKDGGVKKKMKKASR